MRNFLKHNLLSILVCLSVMTVISSATTLTRPYGASDYAGGTKAVGSKVNAEFANIVSWLNNGNIATDNIATGGVATANIASLAVTTAKINNGAVTKAKLDTANLKVTGSSSVYALTGTLVPATITNLSTTFVSNGRPVSVRMEPNPGSYLNSGATLITSFVSTDTAGGNIFFLRDSSTTAHFNITIDHESHPCSMFSYTELLLTSGNTYTFTAKASLTAVLNGTVNVVNCRLVVEEL